MQTKLTEEQISNCREIAKLLLDEKKTFNWFVDCDYWLGVYERLCEISKHGTSDGKPYIEPEPPIPEGYRKANADEYKRRDVQFWHSTQKTWVRRTMHGEPFDPPKCNTYYIVPADPPLTDQDAKERPWVMVRDQDHEHWQGPAKLLAVTEGLPAPFIARCGGFLVWEQARRATPEEIEAANGNS